MINIFSGFTRDIEAIANRLSSSSTSTTLLAPINSAIEELPRKPWEDPNDNVMYEGDDGKDRAQENLKKFVESHIVPKAPWHEGEKVKTLAGQEIWWEKDGNKKMVRSFTFSFLFCGGIHILGLQLCLLYLTILSANNSPEYRYNLETLKLEAWQKK